MDVEMSEVSYRASRVHKALANPLRYRMLELIAEKEGGMPSGELAERLDRTVDSISYHLDKMKDIDLIYTEKDGRQSLQHIKRWDLYGSIKAFEALFARDE
jgi:DNA-binding transcriptional ArsR family regulator